MLHSDVSDELILPVVSNGTFWARVRFFLVVPSLVVISVSDRCEHAVADAAFVGPITSVDAHVNLQVTSFVENFSALNFFSVLVLVRDEVADECFSLASSRFASRTEWAPSIVWPGSSSDSLIQVEIINLLRLLALVILMRFFHPFWSFVVSLYEL
jgi:hypothetical protein